jgi:tight adherence protein C
MTLAMALTMGAGVGVGLFLLIRAFSPAPLTLAGELAEINAAVTIAPDLAPVWRSGNPLTRRLQMARWMLGDHLARVFAERGWLGAGMRADLAILGRSASEHFARKILAGILGLLWLPTLALLLGLVGIDIPIIVPVWGAVISAAAGFLVMPDAALRRAAADRRRDFAVVIGSYLDLVAMRMASGSGLAEALAQAANVGQGPAFAQLRGTLEDAQTDGLTSAAALGRLGEEFGLKDLVDTAARLALVDHNGALIEASLRAQAASLRDRELADAHGRANEQSQSMVIAQVGLAVGFIIFLGYPALAKIMGT